MATQSLSPEMTSYARLCLAINDVCTKSLRDVLLRNVPSQDIKQAIVARWGHQYNGSKFDKYPYSLLFPNHQLDPNFSVSDCDLSLLYFLIRNASSVQKPLLGWGKSVMNNPQDTSIGANVERLHELRNTVIHLQEPRLSNQEFNSYWNKLRDCVNDIDTYLGGTMYQQKLECLKTDDMDPDYANRLIETFRISLQDLQARQHEQGQTLSDIKEVLNQGFHDIKTADDCTIEGLSEVKDLIKDENRQLPQIAKDVYETKDIVKVIFELMEGKAKENDKTQPQLNSDQGVRTENTTSNQDEHESEITLEKHDSRDSENTTDCNKNKIEKTDVDKSSRSESLAVQVQLKTNDVLVRADYDNNGGIEIGDRLITDLASGLDGKLCITKKYAFIKSNLTKESGLVIAKCLLKQKLLSQDAYDRMGNTCCARRHPIDILLKKVIHGGKEEIVEAFFKRLKVECPLIARAVKDTTITEMDRLRFAQLEARGVQTGGLFQTMWCVTSGPDVRFFKYHLSESEEDVEHITDVMLSRLHFSIQDHSSIIDCPTSDDRISVLFQKMQLYKLDIVEELSDVVKPELHKKWMEFRSTQDPWWSGLFQWMKQSKPVIDDSFEFEEIELKEVETGSIILKFIAGVNFSVDLLKPESLKNKIKTLFKRGCLESKTETKGVAHVTVYIESPPNKDREEIHIYIDFHATDVSIEAEDHQDEMRIRNRDIMLEEMNPARLKQWMLDQPCIQKSHRDMLESKLSEKGLFRQEEMTVLLDFINGLENGEHLLEKYCEKNDLYVYNKVFRKHQESHSHQEISGHRAAVTYVKGGGLQELFSFSIIFNDEETRMADKGGTGTSIFKLTVKVELLGKSKVNEHVLDQLQKAFQGHIANLQQHLQSYPELQSQHIDCVTNKKKYLGFEFLLKSAKALEELKLSTENDRLVNALSDFLEKNVLGLDIGIGSQHLCFKCKIEGKQYALGLAHFMESSSESSAEESEEADDQQEQSHEPQGAASSTEPKEKQEMTRKSTSQETSNVKEMEPNSGTSKDAQINDSTQSGNKSQLKVDQQKLSGNEGALHVSSSEGEPQIETTQTLSGHGGGEVHISSAAPPQTGSSVDVVSFVQMDQAGSADKPISRESRWSLRKFFFWMDKSETKANQMLNTNHGSTVQSVQQTVTATNIESNGHVESTEETKNVYELGQKLLVKHFYLYLPYHNSVIASVFVHSNWMELHGKPLKTVHKTKHLWGVTVHLNPDILNNEIKYQFGMEKYVGSILRSRDIIMDQCIHILDSSTIQRKYWMRVNTSGVLDHVQHIMHHCREDTQDSILQLEVLITDLQKNLNETETLSILNQLEKDNLVDNDCSLMFALLLAKLEYFSFVEKSNKNLVTKLFQTLCLLNRSNLPSTSTRCLHELSYYVMEKKLKSKFCLVHWMTYMFPFQPEATFIQEINRFHQDKIPIVIKDKESLERTLEICKKVKERILKEESEKGPEFVLALVKHLPLAIAMKVHSDIFDEMSDLVELGEKIQDIIVVKMQTKALKYVNRVDIGKLKILWKMVKSQRYINRLTGTFERHLLLLFNRMPSFNNDYKSFFEDEMLFVDDPNKDALLQLIAKSPIREVHEYMKTLTPGKKFFTITDDVVEKWFETALDKYISGGVSRHSIKSMYTYLCDAVLLQQPGNNADLTRRLETKLYNMKIKSLKPAELVKMADEIFSATKGSKLAHEIFQHHIEHLLKEKCNSEDPRDILITVFGKDIWLSSDWQVRLLTTLLDSYALKAVSQTQETIFSLLPHQNFWKAVLKVQGEVAEKVKMHPSYIAADECISFLRKSLKDMTISVSFLEKIVSENLMLEVASILFDDDFRKEQCHYSMKDYHSCVIKERERTVHITSTLENIIKYFPAPDDLGLLKIKEKVHMVSETLKAGNITIKEMKESLWKPYDDVPLICEKLQTPSKSSVYWNVCMKNNIGKDKETKVLELGEYEVEDEVEKETGLQEDTDVLELGESAVEEEVEKETGWQEDTDDENMNYSDVYNTHDENSMQVLDGLTVLKDLFEKGCDLYKKIWEDFYKGSDIHISFVQEMFGHRVNIPEEIGYIEDFEGNSLSSVSKSALLAYWNFPRYENTVKAMEKSLAAFKIDTVDDEFRSAMQAFKDLAEGDADSITIFQVHSAVKTVEKTSNMLSEDAIELLNSLGESSTLVVFLSDIVDEDIRNLIDAVEEVSEKYVNESTVSGLIEVKRFLHPFLIKDSHLRQNQTIFFRAFAEKFQELVFKDAVLKTTDCMENLHNLKSLYNNVADRSERTREITKSIIENGKFNFSLQYHECMLTVSYKQKETISTHLKAALVDLRSRALLLMNTARKENLEDEKEDKQEYLGKYVTYIDLGLEIAELCTSLYVAGHFSFTKFDTQVQPDQLEECRSKLKEELITWQSDTMQCREKYYYMNFLHGGQIQAWYNYIQTESIEGKRAVDTFLKFIHPNVSVEAVGKYITKIKLNVSNQEVLMNMGMALEQACKKLLPVRRLIELPESSLRITDSIQKRKLLIVSLDEHSKSVVRTVLSLYQNNTHVMPEAHQVLFCRNETVWDEIDLLLKRCLGASKFGRGDSLFCLANVELLSNEYQFQLVDALRKLPKDDTFLLVIIFRGAEHHPFLHEFSDCVTRIHPMTEPSLQMCLQKECPEVFTVTSEVPGLGKTETIKRHAHKIGKTCITLHISGPLSKYTLVERLSNLNIKEDCVLHIDIGNTPDTEEFDTFLFELLLLHFVSAYTTSVFLTATSVCIEIANTMNNTLSNSLYIATSFKRKNIQWEGFESFQVSTELHSPIQVICHYLNAVEDGTLDKRDIIFKSTKAPEPLPIKNCIFLLQKYLKMNEINEEDISFTLINSFIRVLADQLKKMSCSSYFRISNLSLMFGTENRPSVKTDLVKAMIKVCLDFAGKSIKGCRQSQKSTAALSSQKTNLATSLASRVEGMIRWEHTNHLMFLFHSQDIQTLSVLYRSISNVPSDVKTLFKIQKKELLDFGKLNQKELQDILQKVARSNPKCIPPKELQEMAKYYALTPDNLLKMVLIILRIRAHIPVIVMGETGCGKTSLIQYLSKICDVDFIVKTIHAGIEEKDIIKAVEDANSKALQSLKTRQQIWLFLDEINTNDHIWLLNDIICHHSCLGRKLAPNLVLLSACNPYRLRSESAIHTAGLADKARTDELSRLLYRVHPLPETMVDYVWDFGSLSRADEKMYIEQMVCGKLAFSRKKETLLADALVISQEFIRSVEEVNCCVSLRDVRRCTDLAVWFKEQFLPKKKNLKATVQKGFYNYSSDIEIRAIILALAHCYHSRLIDSMTRKKYREALFSAFRKHHESKYGEEKIKDIIREEQQDILDRMELPGGVAKNTALQENVFVILISILNRIPIFVVGKPGCSKSLSMQVIRSNLRGPDSKDELFKLLPQLYCVSFQGSESSTSDGIIKVFEKAQKYKDPNSQEDVLSVVILDEIGLAEVSRFNPLKVLHSLLEPLGKPHPDVAVVGISNWALDASKMNRAIHLSRPEMDEEELILTGKSISDSFAKSSHASCSGISPKQERNLNISDELKGIASGYFEFVSNQRFRNFFGLRDYYSLVKYFARELANMTDLAINQDVKGNIILKGIHRNFGGLPSEIGLVRRCFEKHLKALHNIHGQQTVSALDMIKENVSDRSARHLLLITTGDSVLGILEKQLKDQDREHMTIFGSKFEEDLTNEYSYRILSRIILCMEQGIVLILKDLETVYGSLYDMLNQNYTIVGKKKNCRIALGPYSNPMCYVHDDFRCIVLIEESELDQSDPPFLNRFEKQSLQYSEILGDENEKVVSELQHWVASVTSMSGKHFSPEDIIPIYSTDMIPTLVLYISDMLPSEYQSVQKKIKACKLTLLQVVKPEAIARIWMTEYRKSCSAEELEEVTQSYFQMPIHEGLEHFLQSEIGSVTEGVGKMIIVFTNSNIHTDLKKIVPGFKCQIEKLGAFKSEKQLTIQMNQFWHNTDRELLFLQCKADTDGTHILLSKSIIEKLQAEYCRGNSKVPKHVCLVVHLGRRTDEAKTVPQIDFLAKWKLVMLDSLSRPKMKLPELLKWNLMETIEQKRPLKDYIKEQIFAAFTCIRYGTVGRSINNISHIITQIGASPEFLSCLEIEILKWIDSNYASGTNVDSWQVQVACDANALYTASSFIKALEGHILSVIFNPLAMLIYELEKQNLLDSFFVSDLSAEKRRHMWYTFFHGKKTFTIDNTPLPAGPECYAISTPVVKLRMPFSKLCFDRIEKEKDYFSELLRSTLLKYEVDEVEDLDSEVVEGLCNRFSDMISCKLGELLRLEYENCQMDYVHDFCTLVVARHSLEDINDEKINVMFRLLPHRCKLPGLSLNDACTFVHTTYWTNFSLIMAEFMFIETCRELVDIKGVLHEIFTVIEADIEEHYSTESDQMKDEEGNKGMEASVSTSDVLSTYSSDQESNKESIESIKSDDELFAIEDNNEIRLVSSSEYEFLEQIGEDAETRPKIISDDFDGRNVNFSSGHFIQSESKQTDRLEASCTTDSDEKDKDGYNRNLDATRKSSNEIEENLDACNSVSRMFEETCERHELHLSQESVDILLKQKEILDGENKDIADLKLAESAVSESVDEGSAHDWIRDIHMMGINSVADVVSEIAADSFAITNDNLSNCSGYILKSDSEHNYRSEADSTSEGEKQSRDRYNQTVHAAFSDTRSSSSNLPDDLDVNDTVSRMFEERHEVHLTRERIDTLLQQEDTLDGEKEITVGQFTHYPVSESVDEGSAHEWIRDSHVSEINSRSSEKPEEDEENTIKKFLEGAIRTKSGQEQRDAPSALQHVLVETLCKIILPSACMFKSEKDLANWNIKVQSILSFAGCVSQECNVFYGLRFCSDLTSLVLIPYKMDTFWLVQLGNLIQRDVAMDTEEFMEKISEMIIFFGSNSITEQDRQKIFSQFIFLCLQAYEDSNVIDWFLYMVETNAVPDGQLTYLKNPLHYAYFLEMTGNVSQNIFCQVLDLDPEEACQVLQESNILSSFNSNIQNQLQTSQHNIPLAVLLVDVFEQGIFHLLHPDIETLMTETAVERLLKVERIIFTEEFSLRQLLAIAYFRRFVKTLGVEMQKKEQELNQAYFQKLNACLRGNEKEDGSKRLSLQLFLLKVLKSRLRLAKFNKVCQNLSGKLTFISSLWKCNSLVNSIDNAPLALYNLNCHERARSAFEIGNDELKNFIRNAIGNSDQMLSLHSILIEQLFLKRTVMELTDDDRNKANEVEKLCKECEMDEYNFRLIQFHLGKRDYEIIDVLNLNLHQGSSETDMQIATFVIELASLALSSRITGCNFIQKCFLEPEEILGAFLPGITGKEIRTKLSATKVFLGRCTSHHRFASNICMTEDQCPKCLNAVVEKNAPITETPYSFEFGMNELVPGTMLTTISQQLLQMIIHGLLTASLAAGYSMPNQISGLLQKSEDEGGVAKYLYQSVQKAFRYLEDLMEIRQTDLDYFLHVLLCKTKTLLCEACPAFTKECERNVWEKEFTHIINSLIHERFDKISEGKRQVLEMHGLDETAVEHQVEEISEVGWCPYLFRLTSAPSLENLSLELYQENNANSFPFLALVLKALPQLELIQHIKPLISWHKACVTYASYHRKKADCVKTGYTVSSFIHEEDDHNQREMLKRKFDLLKKAWETIREQATSVKALPVMERLHDMSKLENCLIMDQSSPLYKVLEVLVSIQNNLLDETLALSVQKYVPALHFLQKNTTCASLPCVSVADVKKDHIINFKWSEDYLKFSQCNIQYGHGRKIAYDFRTIEMELANSLILGKGYLLLEESFPRIIFSDELYRIYILIIQELKDVIPQQKLTSDIEAGIQSRRERDPKLIADFLNHFGIIISLLRRTGGKPETPLVEFIDNWSYVLTRPFPKQVLPNPENAIQLCHIVELNELLEEMNADGVIESLGDEYRVPLEGTSHTCIDGFLSSSVLLAEVILKAEKRFVHRCLLHREVAPMDCLLEHLRDQYFWPEGLLSNGWLQVGSHGILLADVFPADVRVQHITSYLQFLMAKIECIGGAGFTVELLWTDHVMSTTLFYKQLDCSSVTYFCESLSTFLKYLKSKDLRITHGTSTQNKPARTVSKSSAKKKQKKLFNRKT